ncbi:MAG: hypothetical protein ABW318_15195 [Vicinamibacterales bacterium]
MANVAAPYGMYPRRVRGSQRYTNGGTFFPVTVNDANPIWWGAPCALVAGSLKALTASPTTTGSANSPVGTLAEAVWLEGCCSPFHSYLPANAVTLYGPGVGGLVMDDPGLVFMIQADATLDLTAVGKNAALVNVGAGNAFTKRSTCALGASTVALTATLAVRIIRVLDPGALFPDCLVQWNGSVHQYVNGFAA